MLELFRSPRRAIVWFVEASLLALLGVSATGVVMGWAHAFGAGHVLRVLLVSVVAQASMYYHGLYGARPVRAGELITGLLRALVLAGAVLVLFHRFLLPPFPVGRTVLAAALGGAALVLPAWRVAFARVMASPLCRSEALVLGGGTLGRECAALLAVDHGTGLRLAGMLLNDGETAPAGVAVLGRYADVARVCAEHRIERVVVAITDRRGTLPIADLLDLKLTGVAIEEGIDLYERVTGKVFVPTLKPADLVFAQGYQIRRGALLAKRAFDLVAAAAGLLLGLPILAAAAIAVKLDSRGPVLYSQERAGVLGRTFRIHKLRSMRTDAEARGAVWALVDDPRVTRVGRFLRRTRIDELPQLWNVLVGEMSLVGPRPERPVFVAQLEREIPFFARRLCMKPGLTGHAQVRCRYGASIEDAREKLAYDLFYIKRFSLWFDLSILVDTVKVVLLRIGSR